MHQPPDNGTTRRVVVMLRIMGKRLKHVLRCFHLFPCKRYATTRTRRAQPGATPVGAHTSCAYRARAGAAAPCGARRRWRGAPHAVGVGRRATNHPTTSRSSIARIARNTRFDQIRCFSGFGVSWFRGVWGEIHPFWRVDTLARKACNGETRIYRSDSEPWRAVPERCDARHAPFHRAPCAQLPQGWRVVVTTRRGWGVETPETGDFPGGTRKRSKSGPVQSTAGRGFTPFGRTTRVVQHRARRRARAHTVGGRCPVKGARRARVRMLRRAAPCYATWRAACAAVRGLSGSVHLAYS
jgi:hypothetical protein